MLFNCLLIDVLWDLFVMLVDSDCVWYLLLVLVVFIVCLLVRIVSIDVIC